MPGCSEGLAHSTTTKLVHFSPMKALKWDTSAHRIISDANVERRTLILSKIRGVVQDGGEMWLSRLNGHAHSVVPCRLFSIIK